MLRSDTLRSLVDCIRLAESLMNLPSDKTIIVTVTPPWFGSMAGEVRKVINEHEAAGWRMCGFVERYFAPEVLVAFESPGATARLPRRTEIKHIWQHLVPWLAFSLILVAVTQFLNWPRIRLGIVGLYFSVTWIRMFRWMASAKRYENEFRVLLFGSLILGLTGIISSIAFRDAFAQFADTACWLHKPQIDAINDYVPNAIALISVAAAGNGIFSAIEKSPPHC